MWNINIRTGAIWVTKSYNETDEQYDGMFYGNKYILILSAFTDLDGYKKYTYVRFHNIKKEGRSYVEIEVQNRTMYLYIDELCTGDQRALSYYVTSLDTYDLNEVIDDITTHFKVLKTRKPKELKQKIKEKEETLKNNQIKLHKFGIDVIVSENDNVTISKSGRLILSQKVKDDILDSKTDNDLELISNKYHIYPIKAIKEIKNRLVYQYKQKLK